MHSLILSLLLAGPVRAADTELQAEVQRVALELRDRVAAARWEAADGSYRRLVAMEGATLRYEDHWAGFLAAQALGDAIAQAERLEAARSIQATSDTDYALAVLMAWYGRVELHVAKKLEPRPTLSMVVVPFEPDQRRVLEAANEAILAQGTYTGLLPLGMYRIGESSFEIVGEETPVVVKVRR